MGENLLNFIWVYGALLSLVFFVYLFEHQGEI